MNVIGTKWIYKNKSDENGNVTRNNARLVVQGYTQREDVDFDETFTLVSKLGFIILLIVISYMMKFKLYQMYVKIAILNGYLNEEVYVEQRKGFTNFIFPNHVLKLKKSLYGLKQAPRDLYERFNEFLVNNRYKIGGIDKTLCLKNNGGKIIIAQIYIGDMCQTRWWNILSNK